MDKPLSFSGYKRFTECPKKYEYYDIDKHRPEQLSSALIVGSIIDECVGAILKGEDYDLNSMIEENTFKEMSFFTNDLDLDLIDLNFLENHARDLGWTGTDDIGTVLKGLLADQKNLSAGQTSLLATAVWESLHIKITAMLASFNKWILPQIKNASDIQLHLDDGKTHGYLDFTAELKDGRKVLFDLKTSSMPYSDDAVLKSPQLSLYAAMHNYEYAGFIVLCKNLNKNKIKTCIPCGTKEKGGNRKNCATCKEPLDVVMEPTSFSQLLVSKVPEHNKSLTKEALYDTIKCIDNGIFPRNLNSCFNQYGQECPYVSTCWKRGK